MAATNGDGDIVYDQDEYMPPDSVDGDRDGEDQSPA